MKSTSPSTTRKIAIDEPVPIELKTLLQNTAGSLKGSDRRIFMAKTARLFGPRGHRRAERELGWDRKTLRKGEYELQHEPIRDQFATRGRKKADSRLPNLLRDIQTIVMPESQTDPTFHTTRRYRRITAPNVRKQLIDTYGYTDEELPTSRTLLTRLNELDYRPRKVVKSKPKKNSRKPMPSSIKSTA